ncbi:hypothetical protein [Dendronalium sp. ChiSLP03b]|nr:hypothetical protein [Dendronalium sp. ChiSLP03b]MDZ8204606.1 hypothetical protein [Dendronalium sp. ChiSLP03b]
MLVLCCQWNRIEDKWYQIKEHEIAGLAVIAAMEDSHLSKAL